MSTSTSSGHGRAQSWLLAAVLGVLIAGRGDGAEIRVEPSHFIDLGYIYQGQVAERSITLANDSEQSVSIAGVQTSCGCTTAASSYEAVPPRGSIDFSIRMDTTGKPEGHFAADVLLNFGDAAPAVPITLHGNVVIRSPDRYDFGDIYRGRTRAGVAFDFKGLPNEAMGILGIDYDKNAFDVRIEHPRFWNSLEHARIKVACKESLPPGRFDQTITIRNNSDYLPDTKVVLLGRVLDDVEMTPESISLGVVRGSSQPIEKRIRLYSPYERPFTIDQIDNPFPDQIVLTHVGGVAVTAHVITATVKAPFPLGQIQGSVHIETSVKPITLLVFGIQK